MAQEFKLGSTANLSKILKHLTSNHAKDSSGCKSTASKRTKARSRFSGETFASRKSKQRSKEPFIKIIAPFVVPVLTGTCSFVAASIPPKGGTTNTACKKSQPIRVDL